jgi:hypothetical protein
MTTHRTSIDNAEQAFNQMRHKLDGIVKPLITYPRRCHTHRVKARQLYLEVRHAVD